MEAPVWTPWRNASVNVRQGALAPDVAIVSTCWVLWKYQKVSTCTMLLARIWSIQTLASKLKYISVWKSCIVGIMITVSPCRLDVDDLCDQCVNSTDCSRTCSDFTCTCDFNYNGTLCDECMHKTSITNTLGCLQAFTQATSSAGKCFRKFYVWLNWTLTIFIFTAFFGEGGRKEGQIRRIRPPLSRGS